MALLYISAIIDPYIVLSIIALIYFDDFCKSRIFYNKSGNLLSFMFLMEALSILTIAFAKFVLNF
jgi:hypothetical protein